MGPRSAYSHGKVEKKLTHLKLTFVNITSVKALIVIIFPLEASSI